MLLSINKLIHLHIFLEYLEKSIIINYFMTDSIMCHKNVSIQLMILLQMVW